MAIDFSKLSAEDRAAVAQHFGRSAPAAKPGNKYHAVRTEASGRVFDSKKEAARYQQLEALERAGEIAHLERQVDYPLSVNGVVLGYYRADFRYKTRDGATIVEDAKGHKTKDYRWKKKHLAAEHGITILET